MKAVGYFILMMSLFAGQAYARIGAEPEEASSTEVKTETAGDVKTDTKTEPKAESSESGANPTLPADKTQTDKPTVTDAEAAREAACETRVEKFLEYFKLMENNPNKGDGKGMYGLTASDIRQVQKNEGQCQALQYIQTHRSQR